MENFLCVGKVLQNKGLATHVKSWLRPVTIYLDFDKAFYSLGKSAYQRNDYSHKHHV